MRFPRVGILVPPLYDRKNWVPTRGKHINLTVYKDNNFPRVKDVGLRTKFGGLRLHYTFWGPGLFLM